MNASAFDLNSMHWGQFFAGRTEVSYFMDISFVGRAFAVGLNNDMMNLHSIIASYRTLLKGGASMEEYIIIYTPCITVKGRRIFASNYGLKVFRLEIPKDKYKPK